VYQNRNGCKQHCRQRKGVPAAEKGRAAILESPQNVIGRLAQNIGILKRPLQEKEGGVEGNWYNDKQQAGQGCQLHVTSLSPSNIGGRSGPHTPNEKLFRQSLTLWSVAHAAPRLVHRPELG
jgi:hypothetical protein